MKRGRFVESVTLVVSALAAGAGVGVGNVASTAVMDAYQTLKRLVVGRLTRTGIAESAGHELVAEVNASAERKSALQEALTQAGVDDPTEQAAQELLDLIEAEKGKFQIDASQAKGLYIGDHGTQHNHFS
jgi:hypothetical protein